MRKGVLLAENAPSCLLNAFNTTSLEDAFLRLCEQQGSDEVQEITDATNDTKTKQTDSTHHPDVLVHNNDVNSNNNSSNHHHHNNASDPKKTVGSNEELVVSAAEKKVFRDVTYVKDAERRPSIIEKIKFTSRTKMKALLAKNFVQMIRQPA